MSATEAGTKPARVTRSGGPSRASLLAMQIALFLAIIAAWQIVSMFNLLPP